MIMSMTVRSRVRGTLVAWCAAVSLTGCAGNGEGLDASGRPIGETEPPPTPSPGGGEFQQIQDTIFTPICSTCHAGASAPVGLRLDAGSSYALLVDVPSAQVPATLRVAPGDPQNSYLVQKIEGSAPVGGRMPLGMPALPPSSIDLVRGWIAGGAVAPAAAGPGFIVTATVPEAGEESEQPVRELLLIFNDEIDVSLAQAAGIRLEASGGDGQFGDGNESSIALAAVSVSPRNPRVLVVTAAAPLDGDVFRLVIDASAGVSLANVSARVLDGDEDGEPGGDFTMTFRAGGPSHLAPAEIVTPKETR